MQTGQKKTRNRKKQGSEGQGCTAVLATLCSICAQLVAMIRRERRHLHGGMVVSAHGKYRCQSKRDSKRQMQESKEAEIPQPLLLGKTETKN